MAILVCVFSFLCLQNNEDATELVQYVPYQWRDWLFVRSPECLLVWNDYCALELSSVSNGWFRYLIDGKVATMYSSGSAESGPDPFEPRGEFIEKVLRFNCRFFRALA